MARTGAVGTKIGYAKLEKRPRGSAFAGTERRCARLAFSASRTHVVRIVTTYRCSACGAFNNVKGELGGRNPVCGRCKERLDTSGAPQEVNEESLARALESSPVPVLVDFWAPWCGPCRMAAPILEKASRTHAGKMLVLKVNSDQNPNASQSHRVQGIPAFIVFKEGREAARQVGLPPESAFQRWIAAQAGEARPQ
jgi:thioredoxin 2